jgi:hypothetical protein
MPNIPLREEGWMFTTAKSGAVKMKTAIILASALLMISSLYACAFHGTLITKCTGVVIQDAKIATDIYILAQLVQEVK